MKNRDIIHYAFINLKKRLMSSIFIGLSVVVLSFFVSFVLILAVNFNENYKKTSLNYLDNKVIYQYSGNLDHEYAEDLIKNNSKGNLVLATKVIINKEILICKNFDRNQTDKYNLYDAIVNRSLNYAIGDKITIAETTYIVKDFFESDTYSISVNFDSFSNYDIYVYYANNENGLKNVERIVKKLNEFYNSNFKNKKYESFKISNLVMHIINVLCVVLVIVTIVFFALMMSNYIMLQTDENDILSNILTICGAKKGDLIKIQLLENLFIISLANLVGAVLSLFLINILSFIFIKNKIINIIIFLLIPIWILINLIKNIIYKISYTLGAHILEGFNYKYINIHVNNVFIILAFVVVFIPILITFVVFLNVRHKFDETINLLNEVSYEK